MITFIQDNPWDYLMYYPLIQELERKKYSWNILDFTNKSISNLIVELSNNDIDSVIIWGDSELKLTAMLMLKDAGIKTMLIDGDRRLPCYEQDQLKSSILNTMSSLAWLNLVSSYNAKRLLIDEGVNTQITLIESPITNFAYKFVNKNNVQNNDEILICTTNDISDSIISGVAKINKKWTFISPTDVMINPETFYRKIADVNAIISNCFIFDVVGKEMGKHFFYIGNEITCLENLGISTHVIFNNKTEPQYYLTQDWGLLSSCRPKYGIQSIFRHLS